MKKILLIFTISIFSNAYSQELETLGTGVIDFLLTNPKTANKTNPTEAAALKTIGNLLSISAQRKHEMNVANAGRSEIVINTNSGHTATVYSDTEGNVYLLYNGTIYPVSADMVNQAKSDTNIKIGTLSPYNLIGLRDDFRFDKSENYVYYNPTKKKTSLIEISRELNIPIDKICFRQVTWTGRPVEKLVYASEMNCKFSSPDSYNFYNSKVIKRRWRAGYNFCTTESYDHIFRIFIDYSEFLTQIVATFTCNWAKDFQGDGLGLDDFQGIKRSFHEGEKIMFVMGYTTETAGTWEMEIYNAPTGQTVYKKTGSANKGGQVATVIKEDEKLPPGVYIYNFTLTIDGQDKISKSEKFEIIDTDN